MKWIKKNKPTKPRFVNYRIVNKNLKMKVASFDGEIWLTQKQMAEIFGISIPTVNEHLKKMWQKAEFPESKLSQKFAIKAKDGKTYTVNHYHREVMDEIQKRVKSWDSEDTV